MKKTFRAFMTLATLLIVSISANAQILYKIEKAGSDKTSYILGTHHFAHLSIVDSINELPKILSSVDKLYGEIDMSQMTDPAAMMEMQQLLLAPADSALNKVLTSEQLSKVKTVWDSYTGGTTPIEMLYSFKPATLSAQFSALMSAKVFPDLNPMEGIDMTMQTRARELGKPVAGLETMKFQMDMLYNRPISEQAKSLMETIDNIEESEADCIELSKAYAAHDFNRILQIMQKEEDNDAEALERILYSRNNNWIKQLSEEMQNSSLMVVVGAGHLPGDRGVLEGLRKSGYIVTAID